MSEWLVQLRGEKFDLEELPGLFTLDNLKIVEDKGKYYLKSKKFNSIAEASKIKVRAEKLLKLINGAVKIHDSKFQPVSIGGIEKIEKNGRSSQYLFPESIKSRSRVSGNLSVIKAGSGQKEKSTKKISSAESWVEYANQDKNLAKVLGFFSYKKSTWENLYKIYEVIEEDMGAGIHKKGWAIKSKINIFTQTANSYLAISDESRHAHEKIPAPKIPMKLPEAKSLIRSIVHNWLREKSKNKE